jgi:hypothetical protein
MRVRALFLAALSFAAAATLSPAQLCPQDDGFVGPCCAPPAPNFPAFPTLTVLGKGGSLNNCALDCQWNTVTTIAPTQVLCDYWIFNIGILGATPVDPTIPAGFMLGKYARTWVETGPLGPIQVWRWLVNFDAAYAQTGAILPAGCKYPFSVLPPFNLPAHYYGHLDYAFTCATGTWETSYVLTHLCPFESHAPFSAQPLPIPAGLPQRTYHFVAPGNFVFGPCPAPDGVILADAQRTSLLIPGTPYQCQTENPIVQGNLTTAFQDCVCGTGTAISPPIYSHQTLSAIVVNCGVGQPVVSLPIPGILPTGLRHQAIGMWVPPTGGVMPYPGPECVGTYLGVVSFNDICPSPIVPPPFHIVSGTGTVGGYPMILFNAGITFPVFESVDIANMLLFPNLNMGVGGLFVSDRIWSFNTI